MSSSRSTKRQSPEARLARDADKLECLVQAREYQAKGTRPWLGAPATPARLLSRRATRSPVVRRRRQQVVTNLQDVRRLLLDLEPWRDSQAVRELDEQLAAVGSTDAASSAARAAVHPDGSTC